MPKGVMVVHAAPADGRDDAFNDWYDDVHLVDVLKLAGFTSARRFRTLGGDSAPYLAIYEIEADDLEAAQASLGAAAASGDLRMSDVLAMDPVPVLALYEQIAERQA
jgi:hypothetical protein